MPNSQNLKRLSKNQNDLVKGIQHLRPRGSYDPLPPHGGYPLPASIRRKFSFAPQLSNLSQISLMPDFASSSLDLGIQLDYSEAKRISKDTPTSLYIHYSQLSLPDTPTEQQPALIQKPSLSEIDTASATPTAGMRLVQDNKTQPPQNHRSQRLRRMRGRVSLPRSTVANTESDQYSTSSSPTYSIESTGSSSPRTSLISSDQDGGALITELQDATDCSSQCTGFNDLEYRLLKRLVDEVPNLFGTFFIVDLQLDNLVRVTSHDILPARLAPNEVLFYDEDLQEIPYKLLTRYNGMERMQTLPFEGDLVAFDGGPPSPKKTRHRFIGQIDLTSFLDRELGENGDIWTMIALEEMEKAGIRRTGRRPYPRPHLPLAAPHVEAEQVPELIRSLHRDYFLVGFSSLPKPQFRITFTSPTLSSTIAKEMMSHPGFLDWAGLESRFMTPRRFVTQVQWQQQQTIPGELLRRRNKLYCIPMFGPDLVCWLCFLVHRELPGIWPDRPADRGFLLKKNEKTLPLVN
ncbi:MAG: hypothetical protein L6R35_001453 [Caloplaca aegaea]|nr:MAG: hypothetical protein L6R35_001453 [Caloplaca aegaea]